MGSLSKCCAVRFGYLLTLFDRTLKKMFNISMKSNETFYDCHLFICTNQPDNPKKCGSKNAEQLRQEVKKACALKYGKKVRVNASGCLGQCEKGIAAVIYPNSDWYLELSDQSTTELLSAVDQNIKE